MGIMREMVLYGILSEDSFSKQHPANVKLGGLFFIFIEKAPQALDKI